MQLPATPTPRTAARSSRRTTFTEGSWPLFTRIIKEYQRIIRWYLINNNYRIPRRTYLVWELLSWWSWQLPSRWHFQTGVILQEYKKPNKMIRWGQGCKSQWCRGTLKVLPRQRKFQRQILTKWRSACCNSRKDGRYLVANIENKRK